MKKSVDYLDVRILKLNMPLTYEFYMLPSSSKDRF